MRKMELGHVPSEECMDVGDLSTFALQAGCVFQPISARLKCANLCTISGSVDLDFHFVSIWITYPDGEPFAFGSAIYLCLRGIQAFTFERGNHIVNA